MEARKIKQVLSSTTEDAVELLKASTSRRTLKELTNIAEGKPFMVEELVVMVTDADSDNDKPRVAIKAQGVYYSGVANDVVEAALDIIAVAKQNANLLPIGCMISKSAGKYGKYMLEIV